LATTGLISCRL